MYFNKSDRATVTNDVGFLIDLREGGKAFHCQHPRKAKDFLPNLDLTLGTSMPPVAADLVLCRWTHVLWTKREARYCGAQPVTHR